MEQQSGRVEPVLGEVKKHKQSKLRKIGLILMLFPPVGFVMSMVGSSLIGAISVLMGISPDSIVGSILVFFRWVFYVVGFVSILGIVCIPVGAILFFLSRTRKTEDARVQS